jgi:chlorite dismutase
MYRIDWDQLRGVLAADRERMAGEAVHALAAPDAGATAFVQMLGHKSDLMVVLFRRSFEELAAGQLAFCRTPLHSYLRPATSYVSIVELGMYEMTAKIHDQLGQTHKPGSAEFEAAFDVEMETQRGRVMNRLFIELPQRRYVCFSPMNKRRGEASNWYSEPFARRASMMREHGMIGRHYAGRVTQVISGSIGYDDWEWGVDLFADDPLVFKKLIYEMRFDEASAVYAEFGPFYVGLQIPAAGLPLYLDGKTPELSPRER